MKVSATSLLVDILVITLHDAGDPLPEALLGPKPTVVLGECDRPSTANAPAVININAWLNKHNHSRVGILLQQLVANLQAQRPAAILQGVGYCFGGKHVLRLAKQSLQAAVAFHPVCHPSIVLVPNVLTFATQELRRRRGLQRYKITIVRWVGRR